VSVKPAGVTPPRSHRTSSSLKRHGTSGVLSPASLPLPRWRAGVVSRCRVANWQRSMASLILMGLSPMLGATCVRVRMPVNQPMRPNTDNVASPTKARRRRRTASAARPLPAAPDAWRCYDFRCQGLPADFFRSSCFFSPRCIRKDGASTMRRLILLLSVGWLPPYLLPSGACLTLGTSILSKPPNAAESYTTPGLRLFRCTLEPFRVARFSVMCTIKSRFRFRRRGIPPWQWPT
jgi:hypothetical protein